MISDIELILIICERNFWYVRLYFTGETTNTFVNENWKEIYNEVKPVVTETIGTVARTYLKNVLDEYSYDDIFPEK